jgi:hypothetical protein
MVHLLVTGLLHFFTFPASTASFDDRLASFFTFRASSAAFGDRITRFFHISGIIGRFW